MSTPSYPAPTAVVVDGIPVNAFTVDALHAYINGILTDGGRARIYHANVYALNLAQRDATFRSELLAAEAIFCDGEGVRLAARMLGARLPERITYADWLWRLAEHCGRAGWSLFFLGGRPGVAARAGERLRERTPALRIAGTEHGYFRPEGRTDEEIVAAINRSGADILIVGFGMPLQELWLGRWWSSLTVAVGLSGGACFDFVSGSVPRCPPWMRRWGLEWAYRLAREPRRMFSRYVVGNPQFFARVFMQRLLKGARS